ncbi:MAG: hypothetical protein II584_00745, partial [Treponema sp.]|nr:hypothetical protein [Treponema sp.]
KELREIARNRRLMLSVSIRGPSIIQQNRENKNHGEHLKSAYFFHALSIKRKKSAGCMYILRTREVTNENEG